MLDFELHKMHWSQAAIDNCLAECIEGTIFKIKNFHHFYIDKYNCASSQGRQGEANVEDVNFPFKVLKLKKLKKTCFC